MTIFNYTVNYIDIALVAIAIISAVVGYKRGIFETIIRFIRAALGYLLCIYVSSNYSQSVYNVLVKPKLLDMINEKIVNSGNIDEVIKNLKAYVSSLPEFLQGYFNTDNLSVSSSDVSSAVLQNVFEPVATVLTKIAVFIAVFIVFFGITGIIIAVVKHRNKKKNAERGHETVLKKTDRLFGILFGIIKAFVLILVIASVFTYFINVNESAEVSSGILKEAQNSSLLNLINQINPFNAITEGLI